jgi:histidine triad (HIT) family protein
VSEPVCIFCKISAKQVPAVVLHEDDELLAFLDITPIRKSHCLIIPKRHFETFEVLPQEIAARIMSLGQQLARRIKEVFTLERAAFLFTGGDVAHAHAHVIPMHEKTDVTSARYIVGADVKLSSAHLQVDAATLAAVKAELGFRSAE